MLLLTGATGLVGSALLPKLLAEGRQVRCLVRDPRRLGPHRVRVQIALGDLADPPSFRNALRGVDTVVHMAASTRDQPRAGIEELAALASWRMAEAAGRAGVRRFLFFSALGASRHSAARLFRALAVAERAVCEAGVPATVVASSLVYAPGDRWLRLIERLGAVPVALALPGDGQALCQPLWAGDLADCTTALLRTPAGELRGRYELAGAQTLTYEDFVATVLRAAGRERPLVHMPAPAAALGLRLAERWWKESTPLTWDEAQLATVDSISTRGSADAEALGVKPRTLSEMLGLG